MCAHLSLISLIQCIDAMRGNLFLGINKFNKLAFTVDVQCFYVIGGAHQSRTIPNIAKYKKKVADWDVVQEETIQLFPAKSYIREKK